MGDWAAEGPSTAARRPGDTEHRGLQSGPPQLTPPPLKTSLFPKRFTDAPLAWVEFFPTAVPQHNTDDIPTPAFCASSLDSQGVTPTLRAPEKKRLPSG